MPKKTLAGHNITGLRNLKAKFELYEEEKKKEPIRISQKKK
jgi:hypothetical protein